MFTTTEVEILERHNYQRTVDSCMFCDYYNYTSSLCEKFHIKIADNGKCDLFQENIKFHPENTVDNLGETFRRPLTCMRCKQELDVCSCSNLKNRLKILLTVEIM